MQKLLPRDSRASCALSKSPCASIALVLVCMLFASACEERERHTQNIDSWKGVCADEDKDGFGFECKNGADCNDHDPTLHEDCGCTVPAEGCGCGDQSAPVACSLPPQHEESGGLLCREGTRYCRNGKWGACEGIRSFEVPAPSQLPSTRLGALIDPDAGLVTCSPCAPDCYRVDDYLEVAGDGGLPGENATYTAGGGITLVAMQADGGQDNPDDLSTDPACVPGVGDDIDCDGIPDRFDAYPTAPPFETDHETIFMDLDPNESDSKTFEVRFYLNTADVYFLLDQTASMAGEQAQLITDLTTGNFLDDPSTSTIDESLAVECADRNFDGTPDNGLKNKGIAGNIACLIRSSGLGAGWFREIPFSADDDYGIAYSSYDFEPYEHRQDIDEDPQLTLNALKLFHTRGNQNWAEDDIAALYSVATGNGLYVGWDRPGVPAKTCPAGRFGYPCFRNEAVPVVILITDAPMMNGPTPSSGHLGPEVGTYLGGYQPVNYQPKGLRYESIAPDGKYFRVPSANGKDTNESFATAYDIGAIDDSFKTYAGDTRGMSSDITTDNLGMTCPSGLWPSTQTYPDAVFKFKVNDGTKPLTISTRGTRHKPTLVVLPANGITTPAAVSNVSASGNDVNAYDLGTLASNVNLNITGSLSGFTSSLPRESLEPCMTSSSGASFGPDALYKFQLAEDVNNLTFSATGSGFSAVVGLWDKPPVKPTDIQISGPSGNNSNEYFYDWNISSTAVLNGPIDGKSIRLTGGDTTYMTADLPAAGFQAADESCQVASGSAKDAVVDFSLASRRTIRIESFDGAATGSSSSSQAAGFDHMIALVSRPATLAISSSDVSGNDDEASAYVFSDSAVPSAEGSWLELSGNIRGVNPTNPPSYTTPAATMTVDSVEPAEMYQSSIAATSTCSTIASDTHDAVFQFNVTQAGTYDFDTLGSNFTTYLSLHRERLHALQSVTSVLASANDASGQDLGSINGKKIRVTGGTTSAATAKWTPTQLSGAGNTGCRQSTSTSTKPPELVYKFTVTGAPTAVDIALTSSFSRPVIGLYSGAGGEPGSGATFMQCRQGTSLSPNRVLDPGTYYVVVHGRSTTNKGAFTLEITDTSWTDSLLACDKGSHTNARGKNSLLRGQSLTPGTYYLVVKSDGSAVSTFDYKLNVRFTREPPVIACNYHGLAYRRSVIERTLDPGNYSIVVRGRTASNNSTGRGSYGLTIRDVSVAPDPLACLNQSGFNRTTGSSFAVNLKARDSSNNPITYYALVRSNGSSSGSPGTYNLKVTNMPGVCAYNNTTYSEP